MNAIVYERSVHEIHNSIPHARSRLAHLGRGQPAGDGAFVVASKQALSEKAEDYETKQHDSVGGLSLGSPLGVARRTWTGMERTR